MQSGGERTYLAPILERIGNRPLPEITQDVVQQLAEEMKPGRKASYVNRCIYTPINAILNYGAKLGMCPPPVLVRPRGHDRPPVLRIPDDNWYRAIWPYLSPSKRAAVLLLRLHGLRASEALKRRPTDVNMARGELTVETSKTGDPFVVRLSEPVLEAIREIPEWHKQRWLFGSQYVSNFHKAIKRACEAAGVEAYGSHSFGRHAFSTAILREGRSLKFLKEAGRWKKIAMPAERYGHLEQSEVDEDVRKIAAGWQVHKEVPGVIRLSAKRSK
jgi:integrase